MTTSTPTPTSTPRGERADLLESLRTARGFLRHTTRGLTDEQARLRPTTSELCLGGLIKHVAYVENNWRRFALEGPGAVGDTQDPAVLETFADSFRMGEHDTLAGLLGGYDEVAARTEGMVAGLDDLDRAHPLPKAPWFAEGNWSARRVLLHVIAETTQHAGHADIIREAIDGAKSMG